MGSQRWSFKTKVKLTGDEKLQKIVQFYLWETPVSGVSEKGSSLSHLGWKGAEFHTLHKIMRERAGFPVPEMWVECSRKELQDKLSEFGFLRSVPTGREFAFYARKSECSKTESLLYFIRNAFAHGGFRCIEFENERYFVLENRYKGQLRGRAVLKESTLLVWKELLSKKKSQMLRHRRGF